MTRRNVYKMFDRLNKRYKVFKKKGLKNNAWDLIQNELLNIYMEGAEKYGMDISRINFKQNVFTLSKNVPPEILDQMIKVAQFAENTRSTSFAYYKKTQGKFDERLLKTYQNLKGQTAMGVNNLQDLIDMIDDFESGALDKELYSRLGSKLYRMFMMYVRNKKLTNKEYTDIIVNSLKTTLYGDELYNWLRGEVDRVYYKKMENVKNDGGV